MVLLFSIKAFMKGRAKQHRTKGQMFGSGLQLCASGVLAEPESATSYRDQKHPHTLKCQARRRARELKPKRGYENKTCFIVVVNLGVARWKGHGSTLWHWALPRTFLNGCREKTHADNAGTLLPSRYTLLFPLCHIPASVSMQNSASKSLGNYCDYVLRFLWVQTCCWAFLWFSLLHATELTMNK